MPAKAVRRPSKIPKRPSSDRYVKTQEQIAQEARETELLKQQLMALTIPPAAVTTTGPKLPITPSVPKPEVAAVEGKRAPGEAPRFIDPLLYGLGIADELRKKMQDKRFAKCPMPFAEQMMWAEAYCYKQRDLLEGLDSQNNRPVPPIMALEAFLAQLLQTGTGKGVTDLPALIETASATDDQVSDRTGDDAFARDLYLRLVAALKSRHFGELTGQLTALTQADRNAAKALAILCSKDEIDMQLPSCTLAPPEKQEGSQELEEEFLKKLAEMTVQRGVVFTHSVNTTVKAGVTDRNKARNVVFEFQMRLTLRSILKPSDDKAVNACLAKLSTVSSKAERWLERG
ncbi:hypothetical protein [Caenimonas koreensis]|uniref:hypothetical protein n=1 Tax=Caenimonas koreensis TaxID=367474 RepID=UPI003784DDD8